MRKKVVGLFLAAFLLWRPFTSMACYEITYDEAQLLLKVAEAEAGNQGSDGMWLIMSTVINRVNSGDFPDNIHDVIYQKNQFYTVTNGAIDRAEITPEAHEALARIEKGDIAKEIIAFENKKNDYLSRYFWEAFEYKDHRFYTAK